MIDIIGNGSSGLFTRLVGFLLGMNSEKKSQKTSGFSHTSTKPRSNRVKIRSYCCRWQPKRMTRAERKIYKQKLTRIRQRNHLIYANCWLV